MTMPKNTIRLTLCYLAILQTTSFAALSEPACTATHFDETAIVRYIHDGDTLHLRDGRKVRLIGINTPEVAHGKHAAEPYSAEAKKALQDLFKQDKTIKLVYGKEKKDHYQRVLAHGFNKDGTNIQAALLSQGLAHAVSFPPNTKFSACYLEQARNARCNTAGFWRKTKALSASKLNDTHIGFNLIEGKLNAIKLNKQGIWLNLDDKLSIGIRPDNRQLFDISDLNKMLNQSVMVSGWLNKSKKSMPYYMRIRHPSALQLSSAYACN
ncbi:MAG: hypothetical protein GQ549_06805 [Gammaproteobacteria bacterium]|nr:hypothetical protein [Gammaproteobacteria bacterium]